MLALAFAGIAATAAQAARQELGLVVVAVAAAALGVWLGALAYRALSQ